MGRAGLELKISECKAGSPVRIQSALSQGHPKAAGRWGNLVKQVPFVSSFYLLMLQLFTLLDCSSGHATNQAINHTKGVAFA